MIEERIARSFAGHVFMTALGASPSCAHSGRCRVDMARTPAVGQQDGFVHGGSLAAIADSGAGYAALSIMAERARVLTVEDKVNVLRAADGDTLMATGRVVNSGRTLHVVEASVACQGRECRRPQGTMIALSG